MCTTVQVCGFYKIQADTSLSLFTYVSYIAVCMLLTQSNAIFVVFLVTGIQVAIIFLGSGRLDDYVECLEDSLEEAINASVDLSNTTSIPVCYC